jgi:hypothetical protein
MLYVTCYDEAIKDLCEDIVPDLRDCLTFIEAKLPATQLDSAQPTAQPAQTCKGKCKHCHAIGHDKETCRTKDPEVMKRRVTRNLKMRKEVRTLVPPPFIPIPSSYALPPYPPCSCIADSLHICHLDRRHHRNASMQCPIHERPMKKPQGRSRLLTAAAHHPPRWA